MKFSEHIKICYDDNILKTVMEMQDIVSLDGLVDEYRAYMNAFYVREIDRLIDSIEVFGLDDIFELEKELKEFKDLLKSN